MSEQLVLKSLEIVDETFSATTKKKHQKNKKSRDIDSERKGKSRAIQKAVEDVKKQIKSKAQLRKESNKRLKAIRDACAIKLDDEVADMLIERAVTGRPVHIKKPEKPETTAFTEEDFKKFEEEYFDESF